MFIFGALFPRTNAHRLRLNLTCQRVCVSVGRHSGCVHWWVGLGGRVSGNLMGGRVVIMVYGESFAKSILLPSIWKRQLHILRWNLMRVNPPQREVILQGWLA